MHARPKAIRALLIAGAPVGAIASNAICAGGGRSAPLPPHRLNVLSRKGAVRLQARRPRNRRQPPAQSREEVARYREVAAGAKSSGNRAATPSRLSHQCSTRLAAALGRLKAMSARGAD
jgi:hypothetical protein